MELGRLSMDCLWHNDLMHDLFFPPLGDARFMIVSIPAHWYCRSGSHVTLYASLYSTARVSYSQFWSAHVLPDVSISCIYHSRLMEGVDVCLVSVSTLVILRELSQLKGERSF